MSPDRLSDIPLRREQLLHSLLGAVNDLVWCTSADGSQLLFVNEAAERIYGRPLAELKGNQRLWLEAIHPADRPKVEHNLRNLLQLGQVEQEYRIVRPDGGVRWLRDRITVICGEDGRPARIGGIATDITLRKEAEAARDHERHLLHLLLEHIPDNIYFKDPESRFVRVSKSLAKKFGLHDPAEAIGKSDADFFAGEHAEQARADERRIMETGEPVVDKIERETWDGQADTWCATTKLPMRDHRGKTVGTFGITRDVTQQKLAEEALARERDLLRTLMDNVPDLIFVKDRAGRFLTANQSLLKFLKVASLDDLIGKTDRAFSSPELAEHYMADDRIVLETGEPLVDREERTVDGAGDEMWLLTTKVPLKNAAGKVQGLVGIGRNITKRKQAAEELQAAKEAADAANRAKSDFLANMSHEIRTPMNAIIGMTELLIDTQLTDTQREYMSMVEESGEALLLLLNDILDFSKIEAGKLELADSPFDLPESLGDTMKSLALRAHSKGLELAFGIDAAVPVLLRGDAGRLRQIVVNLVGNAIKFTHQGEVVVNVALKSMEGGEALLHFAVRDTGIGIPAEKCATIFEEFEQADTSTTRTYGGTGLGLAISSRLVALMRGQIWVESQLGQGSVFHFTIRLGVPDEASQERYRRPVLVGGTSVLIVDDNATNRRILEDMVRNWGMTPTTAADARTAMQLLRSAPPESPFQLVLTDVNMPQVDGFQLVSWIRQDPSVADAIVIMLTSSGRAGDNERRAGLKVASHLMKPVKQSEVFDAIVTAMGVSAPEDVRDEAPAAFDPSAVDFPSLQILLAEDNVVNQKLAIGVLEKLGHRVTVARTGREAVELSGAGPFDLILMDVQMPEMDGFEATRAIRQREAGTEQHIPTIAMTAHAMKGDRERCLEAGMDEYVSKPIRMAQLHEKMVGLLRAPEPRQEAAPPGVPGAAAKPAPEVVNWTLALRSVNGDRGLLTEVIEAFLEEAPQFQAAIGEAIEEGASAALSRAAHSLKGSLLFLGPTPPFAEAERLESLAADFDLAEARETRTALERNMRRLTEELTRFVQSNRRI